jgi:hypothetical protein
VLGPAASSPSLLNLGVLVMPQNAEKVIDHENLFREPEYKEMFDNKRANFEFKPCR